MKLITMTDFVLEQKEILKVSSNNFVDCVKFRGNVECYANFLKKPLELGMFIPCDEDGNVLVEPKNDMIWEGVEVENFRHSNKIKQYQQAKDKVLFKGFELMEHSTMIPKQKSVVYKELFHVFWQNELTEWYLSKGIKTIEDLIPYNLTLTDNAIKQIL